VIDVIERDMPNHKRQVMVQNWDNKHREEEERKREVDKLEKELEKEREARALQRKNELWKGYGGAMWKEIRGITNTTLTAETRVQLDLVERKIGLVVVSEYNNFRYNLLPTSKGEVVPTSERVKLQKQFLCGLDSVRRIALAEMRYGELFHRSYPITKVGILYLEVYAEWADAVIEKGVLLGELPFRIYRDGRGIFCLEWHQGWTLDELDPKKSPSDDRPPTVLNMDTSDLTPFQRKM
jgi:hypothetical protein